MDVDAFRKFLRAKVKRLHQAGAIGYAYPEKPPEGFSKSATAKNPTALPQLVQLGFDPKKKLQQSLESSDESDRRAGFSLLGTLVAEGYDLARLDEVLSIHLTSQKLNDPELESTVVVLSEWAEKQISGNKRSDVAIRLLSNFVFDSPAPIRLNALRVLAYLDDTAFLGDRYSRKSGGAHILEVEFMRQVYDDRESLLSQADTLMMIAIYRKWVEFGILSPSQAAEKIAEMPLPEDLDQFFRELENWGDRVDSLSSILKKLLPATKGYQRTEVCKLLGKKPEGRAVVLEVVRGIPREAIDGDYLDMLNVLSNGRETRDDALALLNDLPVSFFEDKDVFIHVAHSRHSLQNLLLRHKSPGIRTMLSCMDELGVGQLITDALDEYFRRIGPNRSGLPGSELASRDSWAVTVQRPVIEELKYRFVWVVGLSAASIALLAFIEVSNPFTHLIVVLALGLAAVIGTAGYSAFFKHGHYSAAQRHKLFRRFVGYGVITLGIFIATYFTMIVFQMAGTPNGMWNLHLPVVIMAAGLAAATSPWIGLVKHILDNRRYFPNLFSQLVPMPGTEAISTRLPPEAQRLALAMGNAMPIDFDALIPGRYSARLVEFQNALLNARDNPEATRRLMGRLGQDADFKMSSELYADFIAGMQEAGNMKSDWVSFVNPNMQTEAEQMYIFGFLAGISRRIEINATDRPRRIVVAGALEKSPVVERLRRVAGLIDERRGNEIRLRAGRIDVQATLAYGDLANQHLDLYPVQLVTRNKEDLYVEGLTIILGLYFKNLTERITNELQAIIAAAIAA